ncbi:hypothetical protein MYX75_07495, partial [Acidobacteria bacterium AH-259-A15]|nr:hypothetical protein [Acidobacteria bacterium AH-259-A15]
HSGMELRPPGKRDSQFRRFRLPSDVVISPDGSRIIYLATNSPRQLQVWSMDQLEATLLRGADGIIVLNWFQELKRLVPTGK